jgi:ADP-ribose pyrophosphatase YjhB (NUDIX family)
MSVPPNKRLPEKIWQLMLQSMPIPCVDIIFINNNGEILYGRRKIPPCKNLWALPGGRIIKGESPEQAAQRQAEHYGLGYEKLIMNGVFTSNLKTRSSIIISFVAIGAKGNPIPDIEFTTFQWRKDIPQPLGLTHRQIIKKRRE